MLASHPLNFQIIIFQRGFNKQHCVIKTVEKICSSFDEIKFQDTYLSFKNAISGRLLTCIHLLQKAKLCLALTIRIQNFHNKLK
jgi:hypothetical protein